MGLNDKIPYVLFILAYLRAKIGRSISGKDRLKGPNACFVRWVDILVCWI